MATIVELPRLSDTMEEGVIAKWHIAEGDKVKRGQVIADIETDKATMEFESFDAGTVLKIVAPEGETLPLGAPIAVLGKAGEDAEAALEKANGKAAAAHPKAETAPPITPTAPAAPEAAPAEPAPAPAAAPAREIPLTRPSERIAASPVARRLARENGLQLESVTGSGPHGRIVKADVQRALAEGTAVTARPVGLVEGQDQPQKLSQMRKAIARRMSQANTEIPHFYLTVVVDMDPAAGVREQLKVARPDVKVSYNDLIVLAVAKALVAHPEINAYWNGETIVRRGNVHVGIAVAVDEGLVVPVIRHTDQKSLTTIATEARDLGTRARDKKIEPSEMTGSTFTVSNLGMFGIDEFSAVVNLGEGAILAVGSIVDEVVAKDGEITIGKRMKATLSCDHRVMDGAMGARFLDTVRNLLQNPLAMLA